MRSICPACRQSQLVFMASMNHPSTMKSASCPSCGFTTGHLKPNEQVDRLLARLSEKSASPCIGLLWEDHSFTTLPFDPDKALEVVLAKHQTPTMPATLVAFGLTGLKSVGLNNRHLSNVESVTREWMALAMRAFNQVV